MENFLEEILVLETTFFPLFQHILYRQKEQFSDGVGYSWIDGLKDHADKQVGLFVCISSLRHFPLGCLGTIYCF